MKVTFIRKTASSVDTNCPALYRTDRDTFLVVGRIVDENLLLGQVRHLGPNEAVVEIPADVLAGEDEAP